MTGCSAPVPHASLQVASAAHDIEHEPSQRISQVDPLPHEMLLLAPTVISQVAPLVQSTLHESPQVPVQVDSIAHASVQLSPSHAEPPRSHAVPGAHAHEVPVHAGGGTSSPPQASDARSNPDTTTRMSMGHTGASPAPAPRVATTQTAVASARALSRLCTTLHDPRDHANRAGEARAVEDSVRNHANPALAGSRVSEGGPAGA